MDPERTLGFIGRRRFGTPGMIPEHFRGAGSILHRIGVLFWSCFVRLDIVSLLWSWPHPNQTTEFTKKQTTQKISQSMKLQTGLMLWTSLWRDFLVLVARILKHTVGCKRLLGLKFGPPIGAVAFEPHPPCGPSQPAPLAFGGALDAESPRIKVIKNGKLNWSRDYLFFLTNRLILYMREVVYISYHSRILTSPLGL